MIIRPKKNFDPYAPDEAMIEGCIREHAAGIGRLSRLRAYYDGRHAIEDRHRGTGLPNMRMAHGFPRYISTMAAGYLIGAPVRYSCDDQPEALEAILNEYRRIAIDSLDAELARDASVYGKGVELLYADGEARPCAAALDPRDAFVVYDESVECAPVMGVYVTPRRDAAGKISGFCARIYTDSACAAYRIESLQNPKIERADSATLHYFGRVPMIEYWNDEDERGDFENVLSLIDAYDLLQSDRMNDKQQFVDALLVLYGCTLETDDRGRSPGQQLREDKALCMPDSDARVEWLCKQMSEADTEVLRRAICEDIHKMSMVPDLTDQQFAGNSSGVAMRYKLLGLEQLTKIKERWFREALRMRLNAFSDFMARRGGELLRTDDVRMEFTRSLPVNELENAQTLSYLNGILPQEELARRAMQ